MEFLHLTKIHSGTPIAVALDKVVTLSPSQNGTLIELTSNSVVVQESYETVLERVEKAPACATPMRHPITV